MVTAGAIFDVPPVMKPVTSKVYAVSAGNLLEPTDSALGNIAVAPEKFPLHALVVDDEPLIRWSVAESLSDLGIDVEQAADAAAALRMVTTAANPFQVVILDLRLPDMDDLSLLATLRQLLPDSRMILMTAFGTPDIIADAESLGAAVLAKPFELGDLNHLVLAPGRHPA